MTRGKGDFHDFIYGCIPNESRTYILQFNLEKRGSETLLTTEDQPQAPAIV